MVCKKHEVRAFVREYHLLDDMSDDALDETFDLFPHACSWDKEIRLSQVDCHELDIIAAKTLEILNLYYDHEYTMEHILMIAKSFCDVFNAANAPKKPVPFVILLLARL